MSDTLDLLLDSGGSTEPDPDFRRELMARVLAALTSPPARQPRSRDPVHKPGSTAWTTTSTSTRSTSSGRSPGAKAIVGGE